MSALELLLTEAYKTRGFMHLSAIRALRQYINQLTEEELITAIDKLNDLEIMRTLVEAGLKARPLAALVRRQEELTKRMAGEI